MADIDPQTDTAGGPPIVWDYPAIFAAFGGPKGLRAELSVVGAPPSPQAVWMWRLRARIPHAWMPAVVSALSRRALPVVNFIRNTEGGLPT